MYEIHRILVATDFSRHANEALEHALAIGKSTNAEITLLYVDEFTVTPLGARRLDAQVINGYLGFEHQFVQEELTRLRGACGGRTVHTQVIGGRAYKIIVEEAEKQEYDLVVIGTRGWTHLSTSLIGSTTERVVRFSRQPVLSVHQAPKNGNKFSSILCPTDFSPSGNVALAYALSLARQNNAVLYLHHIAELQNPENRESLLRKAPDLLEIYPRANEVNVEIILDRDVEPSNAIIRFAEDRDVDLIVMSTHGKKGIRRVYIGNSTAEVVRQSTRPVLTVAHPFHRKIFSHPLTEFAAPVFPKGQPS
jgi:nucleotide-binding universal stress UspA family protein